MVAIFIDKSTFSFTIRAIHFLVLLADFYSCFTNTGPIISTHCPFRMITFHFFLSPLEEMAGAPKQLGVQKEIMNEKRLEAFWNAGTPTMIRKNSIPA